MKKAKKPSELTLYLVSAEDNGTWYWKFGITKHADPLKRDPKRYREVFRAVRLDALDAELTEDDLRTVARRFLGGSPIGLESLDYKASLKSILPLFDWLVQRRVTMPEDDTVGNPFETECCLWTSYIRLEDPEENEKDIEATLELEPLVRAVNNSIYECHQAAPATLEPMWA